MMQNPNATIIAWVVISKLIVVHSDGSNEDEEGSNDYIAMHVFNNPHKGQKILEDKNAVIRSTYSPETTIMLYLNLKANEYYSSLNNCLNLVLDQLDRKRDLFYNIRVFASAPFETGRAGTNWKFS